jgi:DNA-binding response OmpR family regulator
MSAKTVLVVEDSDPTRRLIEMCLTMEGLNVVHCADGESGLEMARDLLPDVIILDIALPGIDGWEVLERLRDEAATSAIPVLVATAHDSSTFREKAQTATADAFVGKPFNLNDLRTAINRLLERPIPADGPHE